MQQKTYEALTRTHFLEILVFEYLEACSARGSQKKQRPTEEKPVISINAIQICIEREQEGAKSNRITESTEHKSERVNRNCRIQLYFL